MLRLLIRADDGSERPVEVREGVVRIGRSPDNDIVLADANKGVSRAHAELRFENGRWIVLDLNSQNGTWINGARVQRAEVPLDGEITVGLYKLIVQTGAAAASVDPRGPAPRPAPPATVVSPRPAPARPATPQAPVAPTVPVPVVTTPAAGDLPLRGPAPPVPAAAAKAAPARAPKRSNAPLLAIGVAAVIVVAVAAWFIVPSFGHRPEPAAQAPTPAPNAPAPPAGAPEPAASAPAASAPATEPATTPTAANPSSPGEAPTTPVPSPASAPKGSGSTAAARAAAANAAKAIAPDVPVARKPGESVQAWRERASALQARYAYSKVALDRGDYAAAAGGFAAILLEEPGFLDAPQLLVKARDGLRAAAHDAMDAGNRLDAAGDWIGALRKYDQAREIDASTPGLDEAVKRVREKMRVAGNDALKRARQYDALGRPLDALKEYEKAAQWLPAEDPNREVARTRAEQLKAGIK